jgi:hypothetical protein
MRIVSFLGESVLINLFVALTEKLCRIRNLPEAYDLGKKVKDILSNKGIPANRTSWKPKPIMVASIAVLSLSIAGLHGQVFMKKTGRPAVNRGSTRTAGPNRIARNIANRQIRALVDASKDGGLWWFPQYSGTGFDPNQNHQGKTMADAMRARGWEVTELPRGEIITPEKLQGFDIVIRPEPYFCYSKSEAIAYREAVAAGVRLFLMSSSAGYDDPVAAIFGLRFGRSRHISLEQIIPHLLTAGIESLAIPWVTVMEKPKGSVVLAWGPNEDPVLGYYIYSAGYVLFMGTSSGVCGNPPMRNTLEFLERNSSYDLQRQPLTAPVVISAAGPPAPLLISPDPGEVLPQPDAGEWMFKWNDVPGAQKYQITILGSKAAFFLVNDETTSAFFAIPQSSSYIVDCNALGWRWSVRAQDSDGQWGKWSEERLFDVASAIAGRNFP